MQGIVVKPICPTCGTFTRLIKHPGGEIKLCQECIWTHFNCPSCNELTHEDSFVDTDSGETACISCVTDSHKHCSLCDGVYLTEGMLYVGRDSLYYCDSCKTEHNISDPDDY